MRQNEEEYQNRNYGEGKYGFKFMNSAVDGADFRLDRIEFE